MFTCYVSDHHVPTVALLRSRLQSHLGLGELLQPIKCRQTSCKSSFSTIFNLMHHLTTYHCNDSLTLESNDVFCSYTDAAENVDASEECDTEPIHGKLQRLCLETLQCEASTMVAGLRANSSIPYSVIQYVVDSVDKMIGATVEFCTNGCIQMLQDASVSDDVLTRVRCNLQRQSDTLNRPLEFFVNSVQAR